MRAAVLLCLSLGATNVLADTPFYVGAGAGITTIRSEVDSSLADPNAVIPNVNERATGFQLFGGWEISSRWALELGYIDFGEGKGSDEFQLPIPNPPPATTETLRLEPVGYYLNGQYHIPVGDFGSVDLMAGWIFGRMDSTQTSSAPGPAFNQSFSDEGLMIGAAFTVKATEQIYVRAKLDYFNLSFDNVLEDPYRAGVDVIWDF